MDKKNNTSRKNKLLSCIVEESMDEQIKEIAGRQNMKKAQIVRLALQEFIEDGANRPTEAALLVQMSNKLQNIKEFVEPETYDELVNIIDNIIKLKN